MNESLEKNQQLIGRRKNVHRGREAAKNHKEETHSRQLRRDRSEKQMSPSPKEGEKDLKKKRKYKIQF